MQLRDNLKKTIVLVLVVVIFLLGSSYFVYGFFNVKKTNKTIKKYQEQALNLLGSTWYHFVHHKNFSGDWWTSKFPHPKMIEDDGRPNAFMDSSDQDGDGIKDVVWSDPKAPFELVVVSESASYALLRAIWAKDKDTYDRVWKWTKQNLQHSEIEYAYYWKDVNHYANGWKTKAELGIESDHLFAWRWGPTIADRDGDGKAEDGVIYYRWSESTYQKGDHSTWRDGWDAASDADQDIALSLIFADALWGSKKGDPIYDYAAEALKIVHDIWKKETYIHNEYRYFAGGDNIKDIEPGYLSPFTYRIFDDFDPEHNWMDVVYSSYRVFNLSSIAVLSDWKDKVGEIHNQNPALRKIPPPPNLVPDWIYLDAEGDIIDAPTREEPEFGTDAFRTLWRIAVDYIWFKEPLAAEYLKENSKYGPFDFLYYRMNDKKGDWERTKGYNEAEKLASVYWHDGSYCLFESNYEIPADVPDREQRSNDSRANCAQYASYLAFFWASYLADPTPKAAQMIEKIVRPLVMDDIDGFSKREYIIPDDWVTRETKENLAKHVPKEKANTLDDVGTPYDDQDGWVCYDSTGPYWTIFDHSEWNGQMDYFSNTWTWFGLATFAGETKQFYKFQNKLPKINSFRLYTDDTYKKMIKGSITSKEYYIEAKGIDKNPEHRDFFYIRAETTDEKSESITIKVVETKKNSGIYRAVGRLGLSTSDADDRLAGSMGKELTLIVDHAKNIKRKYKIGKIIIWEIIEDFENGAVNDANPVSWWTDSLKPNQGKPKFKVGQDSGIYIWKEKYWHIRFLGKAKQDVFSGSLRTDGIIEYFKVFDIEKGDSVEKTKKEINLTLIEKQGFDGIDLKVSGKYLIFDIKYNGRYQLDKFYIGPNNSIAFVAPLVLSNIGETGTYSFSINTDKTLGSKYSLQINKNYIGKDYPYFGGVIFNEQHQDWTQYDEFSFDIYLQNDVGPIKVDIEDDNGNVFVLNGYNPWNKDKGAGWYKWRSNNLTGVDVNAHNVQPKAIRFRSWWKGWSFAKGKNIDKSLSVNLKKIRNVLISVFGGNQNSSEIIIDNLTLEKINYHYGENEPKKVKSIKFFTDSEYENKLDIKNPIKIKTIYFEVIGKDSSPKTFDKYNVFIESDDSYPGCNPIKVAVLETGENTGIYRGKFHLGLRSNETKQTIGASKGYKITLGFNKDKFEETLVIGFFYVDYVIDNFDNFSKNVVPKSWWIDTLDPASGMPIYHAGKKLGYFLWKEGDVWKLRWSSDQTERKFKGSLKSDGNIEIFKKYNIEKGDRLLQKQKSRVAFSAKEKYAEDGFDFITKGSYVIFDLLIDGKKVPQQTWIGPYEWSKAYSIPFLVKKTEKTRSYGLKISDGKAYSAPNSMQVKKTYFNKKYPYIGKWGLSGELMRWDNKSEFKMWVYLTKNIGYIRVDIEDEFRQTAMVNEYNPWDDRKGAGWYLWSSNYFLARAVMQKNVDPSPIKDRKFWKSYDTESEKNVDVTDKIKLANIVNLQLSFGSGETRNALVYLDDLILTQENLHMGYNSPKKIHSIKLFKDGTYLNEIEKIITSQVVYVRLKGIDRNPLTQDRIDLGIYTSDRLAQISNIVIILIETERNSGIYEGKFNLGLRSSFLDDTIGCSRHSILSLYNSGNLGFVSTFFVGDINLRYTIEDFVDGSCRDESPVNWWIAGKKTGDTSYQLKVVNKFEENFLKVSKKFIGDKYPYFGAWGLKGELREWRNKDELIVELWLDSDPGVIRVDIEDEFGTIGVLNGYNPWDAKRGAGYYLWKSSYGKGVDVKKGYLDPKKIRERKWWKGWNNKLQKYEDVTDRLHLDKIQNVQFSVGVGEEKNTTIYIKDIYMETDNVYKGVAMPTMIDSYDFYYDYEYKLKVPDSSSIIFNEVYLEVTGKDGDAFNIDLFLAKLILFANETSYYKDLKFLETDIDSGKYRSKVDLQGFYDTLNLKPLKGDQIAILIVDNDGNEYSSPKKNLDKFQDYNPELRADRVFYRRTKLLFGLFLLLLIIAFSFRRYFSRKNRSH